MAYKILYLEDQNPASIKHEMESRGYQVITDDAQNSTNVLNKLFNEGIEACLFDFRLTDKTGQFDAPPYAQSIRTKGNNHKDIPIILISNDSKIVDFDTDLTSHDLFDFAVSKEDFLADPKKYLKRIDSFILSYHNIKNNDFDLAKILDIDNKNVTELIDYRFINKLNNPLIEKSIYAYSMVIHRTLIRRIGSLIGEDVLSARLGISKDSKDWKKLLEELNSFKYTGILSDIYPRWWMPWVQKWWNDKTDNTSLRRKTSKERASILSDKLSLNLSPIVLEKHSTNTYFWTICSQSKKPLDPVDGYIINKREEFPWVEQDYISVNSALEYPDNLKYLSQSAKDELKTFKS